MGQPGIDLGDVPACMSMSRRRYEREAARIFPPTRIAKRRRTPPSRSASQESDSVTLRAKSGTRKTQGTHGGTEYVLAHEVSKMPRRRSARGFEEVHRQKPEEFQTMKQAAEGPTIRRLDTEAISTFVASIPLRRCWRGWPTNGSDEDEAAYSDPVTS